MEELVQEYSSICRFCSNSHRILRPIFKEDEYRDEDEDEILSNNTKLNPHIKIIKIAEILLGITIYITDELPKFICVICFDKLMSSYEFRQKCLISIKNLEEKLNDNRQDNRQMIK